MIQERYEQVWRELSVGIVQTQVDAIKRKNISKIGLRVYDGGCIGVAGAMGKFDEAALVKKATANLSLKIPYAFAVAKNRTEKQIFDVSPLSEDVFISEIEEILGVLRQKHSEFSFSHKAKRIEYQTRLKNSQNVDLFFHNVFLKLVFLLKDKASSNILDGFFSLESRLYDRKEILRSLAEFCSTYQKQVELPKEKRLPIVFTTDMSLPLSKLIGELNGWKVGTKSSLFSESIGKKVFHERFNLIQTTHPDDTMDPFFDAEGTVNPYFQCALVKDGVIVSPYSDKKTAAKFSFPLTASAGSEYDGVPYLEAKPLKIGESTKTLKELLGGRMAVHALVCSGGNFTAKGDFGTPSQLAFLFDGEKYLGRLPQLNLSSNMFDMFGPGFIGVSKNSVSPINRERYLAMDMEVRKL